MAQWVRPLDLTTHTSHLWPKLSRHWYNLQKSVFACQTCIWKAFKKRIFQYHSIFEYFVKICQTRQALKLLLIGGIFWTFNLAFAALLQCFMHQIYTWTFVRQIKTLVALYKLKPLQNLTWGNVFSSASRIYIFLRFFYWMLELFRQCKIYFFILL
jgi:hypothetical protein